MTRWERFMLTVIFAVVAGQGVANVVAFIVVLWETWP